MIYDTVWNDTMNDGAALIRFSGVDSLTGRAGLRFLRTFAVSDAPTHGW